MAIGTRTLTVGTGADALPVLVSVFAPEQDGSAWCCRYTIGWPNGLKESRGYGHDALQALWLTLQEIGIDIYGSVYHESGQLSWTHPGGGYGFPVPVNGAISSSGMTSASVADRSCQL